MEENENIEFKRTTGELNEAMKSVSAILNKHKKGTIYFGLKNDGKQVNFQITDSTLRDVSRKVFESIRPQIYPVIEKIEIDGSDVIKIEFSGDNQPYSAFGIYYIRVADEDRELSPEELRKIMVSKEYEENWDSRLTNETISDIDSATLDSFIKKAIDCKRIPDIEYTKEEILSRLTLCSNGRLNNAGRLLFSKNHPVTLKLAIFATESKEIFVDLQTFEGNLFELMSKAISYVVSNIHWRAELSEDNEHRKEIPELPISAIREAIINSFVHARYDYPIFHEIDIFPNRIMITNPGSFASEYKPEDFANSAINSQLRNELIAKALYLCQDVESFGTGFQKIYGLCRKANVPIDYENRDSTFTFIFYRKDKEIVPSTSSLNESERKVLELLTVSPYSSASEISKAINKTERTAQRIIESLRNKGIIVRKGSNKTGYWEIVK